ncbi:MAG: corC 2 [Verrucomicrobiaceae bacterium]|nr:corC 2 [Verrucomicrobiaceae bacterium]MDB6116376.1 corC 2 [Verrucomicrobiaceae bacterium]
MNLQLFPFLLATAAAEPELQREWHFSSAELFFPALAILFFVLLNGFFVASEFAIVKVRESQLEAAVTEGRRGAKLALQEVQNLDAYLSATQLGITLASIALGMVGEPYISRVLQPLLFGVGIQSDAVVHGISFGVGYAVITFLHVVVGELTPKSLAIRQALSMTLLVAPGLHFFYVILKPAIWVLNSSANWVLRVIFRVDPVSEGELGHSEEELRHIVAESRRSKRVTETEKDILLNTLELNDLCVRDIMTPRNQVVSLDLDETFEANLKVAISCKHTRFPLVEGHLDHSMGLIHIKDLLPLVGKPNPDLRKIKRELLPVPEMMPIDKLLKMLLDKHLHLALVVDEFGGAVGVVTLDNVIEEIVGDIQDEFDTEQSEFRRVSNDEFIVEGTLNLYELMEHAGLEVESEEVTTVGGYVTHLLGHLPKAGETVRIGDYEVTATKVDQRRVLQLRFKRAPKTEEPEDDE